MNEREDYLDRLLRGVEGSPEEIQEEDDDFLEEFNHSFPDNDDDENDFLREFEKSRRKPDSEPEKSLDFDMEDIDNIVSNVKNATLDDPDEVDTLGDIDTFGDTDAFGGTDAFGDVDTLGGVDAFGEVDTLGERDLPAEEPLDNFSEEELGLGDIGSFGMDSDSQEYMVNTMDESDMSGYGAEDMGLGAENMFSDLGEDAGNPLEDQEMPVDELEAMTRDLANEIGQLDLSNGTEYEKAQSGRNELDSVLAEEEAQEKGKKGKKKKEKDGEKLGFFKRLSLALFGEDDEEEEEDAIPEIGEMDKISDENIEILRELEGKKGKPELDEKAKKAQKKKEKAEKKAQKKAEKKQAKAEKKARKEQEKLAKPKKEKKVKEPKVVEKSKPLPRKPVILIMLIGVSLVVLINLFSSQIGYSMDVASAKEYYEEGNYVEAYTCFTQGAKVKAVDEELYNKAKYTAYVQQQLRVYDMYQKQGMHAEALSALICGVGRYDKNASDASKAGAAAEYENMLAELEKLLSENYSMTLDQARELYGIHEKDDYTYELYDIIEELGLAEE